MSTTNVASAAFDAFYSGEHTRCGHLLEQVGSFKGSYDVKVAHNTFLNDYYKSGCADPQQLLLQLSQAHDKARERDKKDKGRRKREEDDEETYREEEDLSVLRYNQALLCLQLRQHAQAALILEELFENIEPIDDFLAIKICFLLLELCLLQREPEQAVTVLAYLEKPNAFLTLLRSERPATKIEHRAGDDGIGEGEEVAEKDAQDAEDAAEDGAGADASPDAGVGGAAESLRPVDGNRTAEVPEGPLPSLTVGAFLPRHGRAPDTISRAEYRFFCLMYRARLSVALKNTKAAKKDVKSALELLEQELKHAPLLTRVKGDGGQHADTALREAINCQHHAMVNVLKAYLEHARQNVRKAMKLLTLCQFNFAESHPQGQAGAGAGDEDKPGREGADDDGEDPIPTDFHPAQDEACAALFFNNLGCIHFMMHKPNLATLYFQKALRTRCPALEDGKSGHLLGGKAGRALPSVAASKHWLDRRAEVAYNAGLQMLMCDRPACAFKCFEQCAPVFRTWPRLWLRIAECCIELHRQSLLQPTAGAAEAREPEGAGSGASASNAPTSWNRVAARQFVWGIRGSGADRRWLLTTARTPPVGRRGAGGEDEAGVAASPSVEASAPDGADAGASRDADRALQGGEGALVYAAMCLRNVLILTQPMLPERTPASASGDNAAEVSASAGGGATGGSAGATGAGTGQDKAAAALGPGSTAGAKSAKADAAKASGPTPPVSGSGGNAGVSGPGSGGATASGGKATSSSGNARHQARDLLECEASLLEDVALVKLAYVSLCQLDYAAATRYSRRFLEKSHLLPQATFATNESVSAAASAATDDGEEAARKLWSFQAKYPPSVGCTTIGVLYAAEALLQSGKQAEARALLGGFVAAGAAPHGVELQTGVFSELERAFSTHVVGAHRRSASEAVVTDPNDERARATCGGLSPGVPVGGLTPPAYLAHLCGVGPALQALKEREGKGEAEKEKSSNSKDGGHAALVMYAPSEFPRLGDTQCMLYTNLASIHCQDGNLDEAMRCCERALQVQPRALPALRTLVYILLRRGLHAQALERLKQSRMQGLDVGWRSPQR